jgi:hypothetical protein
MVKEALDQNTEEAWAEAVRRLEENTSAKVVSPPR